MCGAAEVGPLHFVSYAGSLKDIAQIPIASVAPDLTFASFGLKAVTKSDFQVTGPPLWHSGY